MNKCSVHLLHLSKYYPSSAKICHQLFGLALQVPGHPSAAPPPPPPDTLLLLVQKDLTSYSPCVCFLGLKGVNS